MLLARVMVQAVRFRIRPKKWLTYQDPMDMEATEAIVQKAKEPCKHETMQRYGNKHGSFAKCHLCGKKWVWSPEEEKWNDPLMPKQRSLPLPSSSTASTFLEKGRRPTWALTAMPLTPTARASIPTSKSYASSPSPSPLPLQDQATDTRASKKGARPKASTKRPSATRDGEVEELSDESSEYDWELLNK